MATVEKNQMKILVDIGHPAQVHLFRNFIKAYRKKGEIIVTVKDIYTIKELLSKYQIEYFEIGGKSDSLIKKAFYQFHYNFEILKLVKKNKVQIGLGSSLSLAHVSKISKMTSIILDDDDDQVQPLMAKYGHPFADYVLSPDVLNGKRKKKQTLYYSGYHELAYLHPNHFKPDPEILKEAGLKKNEKYFILRFNAFKAHHDVGVEGLDLDKKRRLIKSLKKKGRIFITTEKEMDPEFKEYQLKVSPEKIHALIYYATMLIGDSQTMTSEAAVLGTPAIRSNSFVGRISYLEEQEQKYGLTYGFKPYEFEKMLSKIDELLNMPYLKEEWQKRRERMLDDKIDVTAFLVWFVENYPNSVETMKKNPEYLEKFK